MSILNYVDKTGMTVEEVDKLTGPVIGHPKSATFRTNDVVGLDTMVHVANGLYENAPDDEARELFKIPAFVNEMVKNNWLGSKTGQGFYKKERVDGANQFYALDLKTLEYKPSQKIKSPSTPKDRPIPWIPWSLDRKRRFSGVDLFYALINIVPDIWWEAVAKGNTDPPPIT